MTPHPPLLPLRTALVLLLSLVVGLLAGCLSTMADQSVPTAVLVGGGAAGGALALFDTIVDRRL